MLDAVIFDMDGLLIDTEPLWHKAEKKMFAPLGLELTTDMCLRTTGMRIDEVVRYWHQRHPWRGKDLDQVARAIVEEVQRLALDEGEALEGVREVLALCRERGLAIALASSSPLPMIEAVVDKLAIGDYFSVLCSAADESHGKPHPAVYLTTAARLGLPPERCLAFEDSFPGLIAAKAANMKAVAVPGPFHRGERRFGAADLELNSLVEFNAAHLDDLSRM